jgi:GxxExxY protein
MLHEDITEKIIAAFYKVYNTLGHGFLEKVYENAMAVELRKQGFNIEQQKNIRVYYEGEEVGYYESDLAVNGLVIAETKAKESLREEHEAQLVNYLKATKIEVGLLLNFGKTPEFRRKIFTNDRKSF